MSGEEVFVRLLEALAWPVTLLLIAAVLRRSIATAISGPVRRWKAGPSGVEVEYWERKIAAVEEELKQSPELDQLPKPGAADAGLSEELRALADVSPAAAIMEALSAVARELRTLVPEAGPEAGPMSAVGLARVAHDRGKISEETLNAIKGLSVLRNLAAHGQAGEVSSRRVFDYLALVDAVLFALRRSEE